MLETTNSVDELDQLPPLRTSVPGQRTETPVPDHDSTFLVAVIGLARAGASESDLADAVKRARDNGWSWTPIAIALGTSRAGAVERFGRAIGHPVTRRRPACLTAPPA
jgi:hypothetical protein